MLMHLNKKKGQSALEYAILITIVIAALLTIQMYIKRGVQGRLKSSSDDIGDQFSPDNTNAIKSTRTHSASREAQGLGAGGQGKTLSHLNQESTNTLEKSVILNTQQEYWGVDATAPAAPANPKP